MFDIDASCNPHPRKESLINALSVKRSQHKLDHIPRICNCNYAFCTHQKRNEYDHFAFHSYVSFFDIFLKLLKMNVNFQ